MFVRKKRKARAPSPGEGEAGGSGGASPSGAKDDGSAARIGRYTIESPLGQGGMGTVYLGHDPVIGRSVAIKVITVRPATEEEARQYHERFLREAQAAGALVHPNIVAVHDIGQDPATGQPYIVMEHVEGQDLKKVIKSRAPLPPEEATRICLQIASALDYAHSRGIVHRDIKPANVLISERGQVKITDFGVARLPGSDLTQTDQMVGSPGFMSPEQLRGTAVDGRSDLFALGVILYELLTGKSPFEGESVSEVLYRISTQPADPPSEVDPDVSADFDPILEKALCKDPDGRFQTGREMMAALRAAAGEGAEIAGRTEAGEARGTSARAGGASRDGAGPGAAARPAPPSGSRSPATQRRLGALIAALLLTFIGVNWAIHALFRGPLRRWAGGGAATASGDLSLPSQAAPGLAVVGASLPPAAARGGGAGRVEGGALKGTIARTREGIAGGRPDLAPAAPAIDRPIVPRCAMTYAGPSEIARVVLASRRTRTRSSGSAEEAAARVRLEFSHRLSAGRLVVLVDGRTVYSKPFDAPKGKKGGTLTHILSIPAGRHGVEVRVLGTQGKVEAKSKIAGTVGRNGTAVLRADERAGSRKPLRLEWEAADDRSAGDPRS